MPTAGIVIGHTPDAPGATSPEQKISEWHYNATLARMIWARLDDARLFTRPRPDDLNALCANINMSGVDFVVSLHLNAARGDAEGSEVLHFPGSGGGMALAKELQKRFVDVLGAKDRGTKGRADFALLSQTEVPAVICEPAFIDHATDFIRVQRLCADLATAYVDGIRAFREKTALA